MKRIAIILFVAAALVAGLATAGIWQMNRFMISEVNLPADGAVFEVPPGSSFAAVTGKLVDNGIIESDFWFRLYARWSGEAGRIHAGEYIIEQGATPKSLLEQFTSGAVRLYSFTIIEGWNHRENGVARRTGHAPGRLVPARNLPVSSQHIGSRASLAGL
jgi:UPF0755 protein